MQLKCRKDGLCATDDLCLWNSLASEHTCSRMSMHGPINACIDAKQQIKRHQRFAMLDDSRPFANHITTTGSVWHMTEYCHSHRLQGRELKKGVKRGASLQCHASVPCSYTSGHGVPGHSQRGSRQRCPAAPFCHRQCCIDCPPAERTCIIAATSSTCQ